MRCFQLRRHRRCIRISSDDSNPASHHYISAAAPVSCSSTCWCWATSSTMSALTSKQCERRRNCDRQRDKSVITIYRTKQNNSHNNAALIHPSSSTHQQCVPCVRWFSCADPARGAPNSDAALCAGGSSSDAPDPRGACCRHRWIGAEIGCLQQ